MTDTTNYVPIAPAMDVHNTITLAQIDKWEAEKGAQAREDMMDAVLYVAAAIAVAAILYNVRPLYAKAHHGAAQFRAWLNAYSA